MKIEHCEWSKDNGEDAHGNTIWYCPRSGIKDLCPYDCCDRTPATTFKKVTLENVIAEKVSAGNANAYDYEHIYNVSKRHNELFKEAVTITETESLTCADLAIRLGISVKTIKKLEKEYGHQFKFYTTKIDWSKYDLKIKAMLAEGITLTQICEQFNLKIATVYNHLYTYNKG